ncbi:TAP42-like protein [Carpediemonas membranifera]|uniref:TAP42-like protein n=1 Tax=Carpediemonas membranifera TaxID=201153 RepID=A0A8J6B0A5_9EUKA|nr:TAP42-like protein [Carpediemonas membranifera]|eukprot:KAG9390179.1 TAP42-like protein [Carpediemonas membranifera]
MSFNISASFNEALNLVKSESEADKEKALKLLQQCDRTAVTFLPEIYATATADHRVEEDDLREIATGDMKFLLIRSLLGELYDSLYEQPREWTVPRAKRALESFVQVCRCLGLLDMGHKKGLISRYTLALLNDDMPSDMYEKRTLIVEHHKLATQAERAIAEVDMRRRDRISMLRRKADTELDRDALLDDDDLSEYEREFTMHKIILKAAEAIEMLRYLNDEMELIKYGQQVDPETGLTRAELARQEYEKHEAEPEAPKQGNLPVFTNFNSIEDVKKFALKQAANEIPLDVAAMMGLDEHADDLPEAKPIVANPRSLAPEDKEHPTTKQEEEDLAIDRDDPAARRKAQEWDSFKDDNPVGWGNRGNKG